MRVRLPLVFLLGAVLGGAAVWLAPSRQPDPPWAEPGPGMTRILVAKRPLVPGNRLRPADLRWEAWPTAALPPGSFTSLEALLGEAGDGLRVIFGWMEPGEPVLADKIGALGEAPRSSHFLPGEKRAVELRIDALAGVGGSVEPGDIVDVMVTRRLDGELVRSIILRDVPVTTVGEPAADDNRFRTVTVEVPGKDAVKLPVAQRVGILSLISRDYRVYDLDRDPPEPDDPAPARPPDDCERPWSGDRDIRPDNLIPDMPCYRRRGSP